MIIRNVARDLVLLALLVLARSPVLAQVPPSSPGADTAAVQEEVDDLSVEELVRRAIGTVDQLEREDAREKRQALVEELQRYAGALQRKEPANPWIDYFGGVLLAQGGRNYDAIESLRRFVGTSVGRNYWLAHRNLGELFAAEFPALARTHLREADRLKPNNAPTLFALSHCANQLGDAEDATRYAQGAVDFELLLPRRKITYQAHLARMLLKQQKLDQAQAAARQALEGAKFLMRSSPGELAPIRLTEAQFGVVAEVLNARITADPTSGVAYLEMADLIRERAALRERLAVFEALLVLDQGLTSTQPNPPLRLMESYAELLVELDRLEDAARAYEQILARSPNHAAAKAFLQPEKPPAETPQP